MKQRTRVLLAGAATVLLFFLVQVGALALVEPFERYQTIEDPTNPLNSVLYIGLLLVATAVMLAVIKYGKQQAIRYVIIATGALVAYYVFSVVGGSLVGGGAAALVVLGLLVHPEWYVIDAAGVVMGMGAAALFGVSFGVFPALLLLVGLAVYDAISVYRTKHMLTLAEGVMNLNVPILFVVPTRLGYSFRDDTASEAAGDDDGEDGERDALFIGLGDAVMPTILVASAAFFLDADAILGVPIPALTAAAGTLVGLVVLLREVLEGEAHAGLPLLNGGAILGYLVGALFAGVPLDIALGIADYL
ncbi:presenilin family intramembrane aspartyl protease PSH [Salarchaeum japonicum]|uniref:Presenilin family intramembrane aspartyl protease n=1 Tax=Salarchaeum japonicum TaxID=555573 RepID=A0AAV3T549_9EURY|nr:presenilin family intramembrane aspartyl protease PSH [Salarchaeum japonicum]